MEFDEFGEPQDATAYVVETILYVAAAGVLVTAVAVAPGLGVILKAAAPHFHFEHNVVGQALRRLTRRGLVSTEQRDDQLKLTLTPSGRARLDQYIVRDLTLPVPPAIWDQQWRIVIFDVPEERKHLRAIFRRKLKQLGFTYLQRSAWIYPYPCETVLATLIHRLDIGQHVHVSVTNSLSSDQHFRIKFRLSQPARASAKPAPSLSGEQVTTAAFTPISAAGRTTQRTDDDLIPLTEL